MTIVIPSIKPVDLLASFGLGSLAIGFAFKDILQNWLAGLLILLRTPFRRGDQIKVEDAEGTVMRIEARATIIRTFDGRDIVVPNTTIYTSNVKIHTSQTERRVEINLTVGYVYDIREMTTIIENALDQIDEVLKSPAPQVLCWDLGATSLGMKVRWWISSQRSVQVVSRSRVVQAIKEAFEANDIDPTDPQLIYFQKFNTAQNTKETPTEENNEIIAGPTPPEIKVSDDDPEAKQPIIGHNDKKPKD
jgi:small-conductance mechanosensitive channel